MKQYLKPLLFAALALVGCGKDNITDVDNREADDTSEVTEERAVDIVFSSSSNATVSGTDDELTATINGNDVTIVYTGTEVVQYNLSGTTSDGFLKIYSARKQKIVLNNVNITNPYGAAINVQGSLASPNSGKAVYMTVTGSNSLTDGSSYTNTPSNEDEKGVLFAEGQIILSGSGSLSITANDTVIISATPVPGNEKSVQGIINSLSKIGCDIYDKSNALVHVSGHGCQEELRLMLAMTRPSFFMPVHGEAVHLRAHAKLALSMGMPEDHVFVADNGDTLEMRAGKVRRAEPVDSGVVYVDGIQVGDTEPAVLRDRQRLSKDGIVTCVVTIRRRDGSVPAVDISGRGVSFANDGELISGAQDVVRSALVSADVKGGSLDVLRKAARNSLSNLLWGKTHTRPLVIPVVLEV